MNQSTATVREALGYAQAIPHERRRGAGAANPVSTPVMLILDARGRVRFCNDPDALQRPEVDIVGRPVRELIEGLPLREGTPGYNVAYVRFAYGGETRRRLALLLPSGGALPVDVGMQPLWMERGHCLLLQLRFACEPVAPAAEPVRLLRAAACC